MILVAFRVEAGHAWSVASVRSHAEGLAAQAALLQDGYRSHVFDHETVDDLRARQHGFSDAKVDALPLAAIRALKRRQADRKRPRFIPFFGAE